MKASPMEGMTDSLDLVPIGAWLGKGKRTGSYGGYLMACYNDEEEEFVRFVARCFLFPRGVKP